MLKSFVWQIKCTLLLSRYVVKKAFLLHRYAFFNSFLKKSFPVLNKNPALHYSAKKIVIFSSMSYKFRLYYQYWSSCLLQYLITFEQINLKGVVLRLYNLRKKNCLFPCWVKMVTCKSHSYVSNNASSKHDIIIFQNVCLTLL